MLRVAVRNMSTMLVLVRVRMSKAGRVIVAVTDS